MKKPFVSLLTPTFNRRPYFETLFQCILAQDYPLDRVEWVIGDDGTDKISDMVHSFKGKGLKDINYIAYDEKLKLGDKRTRIAKAAKGDILIHFDDDDFYPPERISHSVEVLMNTGKLVAFVPKIHIYFKHNKELRNVGPFPKFCAPEASYAYRREVLIAASFSTTDSVAEGIGFLKQCQDSFAELTPRSTIVCFSHDSNSVPKASFTDKDATGKSKYTNVKETELEMSDLVKDPHILKAYMTDIDLALKDYDHADPSLKADIAKLVDQSAAVQEKIAAFKNSPGINLTLKDGKDVFLDRQGIVKLVHEAQQFHRDLLASRQAHMMTLNRLFDEQHGRAPKLSVEKQNIAFIISSTQTCASENLWKQNILDALFGSLVDGLPLDHQYSLCFVVDKNCPYGKDTAAHDLLKMIALSHIKKLDVKVDFELMLADAPTQQSKWRHGYSSEQAKKADLCYFGIDSSRFLSKGWINDAVDCFKGAKKLKLLYLECDTGRSFESFVVGKKHRDYFPTLFPDNVADLECEDWMHSLYSPENAVPIKHHRWTKTLPDRRVTRILEKFGEQSVTAEVTAELKKLTEEAQKKAQLSKPVIAKANSHSIENQ